MCPRLQAARCCKDRAWIATAGTVDATNLGADFTLVHRQAGLTGEDEAPAALLRLLQEECKGRDGARGSMGFRAD